MADPTGHIYLIGFMGSGKSSMGRLLSERSSLPFLDMDEMIENAQGMGISELFKIKGEAYFRQCETALLHELAATEPSIIATGGGVPCIDGLIEVMKSSGIVVYMRCTPLELFQYLEKNKGDRPLLQGKQGADLFAWIDSELSTRMRYYNEADLIVEAYYISPEELWEKVCSLKK
jgi:shikimate kinase